MTMKKLILASLLLSSSPAGRRVGIRRASLLSPRSHKHSLANGDSHHQYQRSNSHRHPEGLKR